MNRQDPLRIAKEGYTVAGLVDKHGAALLAATHDWQSPLRSGGAKGPKGQYSDPTPQQVIKPDPLAEEYQALVDDLAAFYLAATNLGARIRRLLPIDPRTVTRGRVNTVPCCLACDGPAPRCRRGLCDPCYTAWLRADRPDMHEFRKQRTTPVPLEHIDPMSHGLRMVQN